MVYAHPSQSTDVLYPYTRELETLIKAAIAESPNGARFEDLARATAPYFLGLVSQSGRLYRSFSLFYRYVRSYLMMLGAVCVSGRRWSLPHQIAPSVDEVRRIRDAARERMPAVYPERPGALRHTHTQHTHTHTHIHTHNTHTTHTQHTHNTHTHNTQHTTQNIHKKR